MKKIIVILLSFVFVFNISYLTSFAADKKATVEQEILKKAAGESVPVKLDQKTVDTLINLVKAKIEIPANYEEFFSEINNDTCRLRWSTNNSNYINNGGNLEVTVNGKGNILNYYHYRYGRDYDYQRRLPKISKTQALNYAKKFIYFVCPDIVTRVDFAKGMENYSIENDGIYRFTFYREYKGIPFYENSISIMINGRTGEVNEFNRNWRDGVTFTNKEKAMKLDKAQAAFAKNIPLELKFSRTYDEDSDRAYLEYSPATQDLNSSIDAITGEKIIENNNNNLYSESIYKTQVYWQENYGRTKELRLTEDQLSDLKKQEGLISVDTAEKIARSMTEIGIDKFYSLNRSSYNTYINSSGYLLKLDFTKTMTKEEMGDVSDEKLKTIIAAGEFGGNLSITFNAKTSELVSLNSYGYRGTASSKTVFDKATMAKSIEAFMNKFKAQKFKESNITSNSSQANELAMKYGGIYTGSENTFVYTRKVKDIPFEDNQIILSFDPTTGKINNYIEIWDTIDFKAADKVIDIQKAYQALFKNNGLKLRYATNQKSGEVKLVYGLDSKKPVCIDAEKGRLINYYNDAPFKITGKPKYKDINKTLAKAQIEVLAEAGMLFDEENFRPDDPILQKEWLYMINKVRNGYGVSGTGELKQKEMDGMYRILINDNIIDEKEKNPDDKIIREVAVKYLLNSLGYKKFAELEDLFNCTFADKNNINPKLIGYVSIAKSLKIVDAKAVNFFPKKELTRADAAVMIYNFLMR